MATHHLLNVLSIVTDQQRYDTLSCNGASVCRTPNIDALAAAGVRFTQAYTNTAICTAERATMLTGLEPHRHGMLANTERNVGYPDELPPGTVPFTRYLARAGYRTGLVGKWHLGRERGPDWYGIESVHLPGWCAPVDHPDYLAYLDAHGLPRWSLRDEFRGTFPNGKASLLMAAIYEGPVEGTFCYYLAERAIAMLRDMAASYRRDGRPFHLSLHFFGPHLPYTVPAEYADLYDPALVSRSPSMAETFAGKPSVQASYSRHWAFDTYAWKDWQRIVTMYWGYVTLIDAQIGRVLAALDEMALADRTAVVFSTDHGGFVGAHRLCDKGPAMYDDCYHIPLVARVPGGAAGVPCDAMVTLMDLVPTWLELAGLSPADASPSLDGRSLLPLLRGEIPSGWPDEVYLQFHGHHFPYPQRGIRTRTHKLVINPADIDELYDLTADPYEMNNVARHPAYAGVLRDLACRLYHHMEAKGDNFRHWMTSHYDLD